MVVSKPNPAEQMFRELAESEGWDVTKRGWPDFICRRNGQLMAVEVKDRNDGLSPQQYETISDLRRAGIPTFVWSPGEGYTEVGPPVGESVFSLKATLAMVRESFAARTRPRMVEPLDEVQWSFAEDDAASIGSLRSECLRSHSDHQRRKKLGTSGSWCSDLVILARRYSLDEILAMTGMPDIDRLNRSLVRARSYLFRFQHERVHRAIGVGRRCTECPKAA